ncbi:regulator [Breoghania sp.]|uniref:regulator n=1 Tax=Breoghania sp. TaxID=2065378 RepID=UPI002606E2A2|nr:regulator [Breoghania sp.]MDJ0933648.1 regulator [Breoghania sp.]
MDLNKVDGDGPMVFVIVGRVWEGEDGGSDDAVKVVNIFVAAPYDDSAVRRALEALAGEGYAEAELDQVGTLDGEPDDPTFEEAYQDAVDGNVAVITFRD